MSDLYFFRKIRRGQWLGVRLPEDLKLATGADGILTPVAPWSYQDNSPLPVGATAARHVILRADGASIEAILAPASQAMMAGGRPFQQSRAALAALTDTQKAEDLAGAMDDAIANPLLPLRLYQAYRDFPAQPRLTKYDSEEDIRLALISALGGSASQHPVAAYSGLLFIVDGEVAPNVPTPQVDTGDSAPARLRVTAQQGVAGVTLQFEADGKVLTNGSVTGTIATGTPYTPSYRWRRTLGMAQRPSADSGAILIPAAQPNLRSDALGAAWADRPFRVSDRLGALQLAGELLNYEVCLFNPHGRCTHSGRVLLKRQRLDPPAPPLRATAQLLAPHDVVGDAHCSIRFAFADDQGDPALLEAMLYRQDYPVVPTGFYGDDDDGALVVARSLGDTGAAGWTGAQPFDEGDVGAAPLPNLSSHNLDRVDLTGVPSVDETMDGQPGRCIDIALALRPGIATRLFLALRRRVDGAQGPESQVAELQHMAGPSLETLRAVPHFELFWGPLPTVAWLGAGSARIMEVQGVPTAPAVVRIVMQHAGQGAAAGIDLVGGYRLWMRDVAAPGEDTPFDAVALVQAVPRLVKAYSPIEAGRRWSMQRVDTATRASVEKPGPLEPNEFILLSEPAAAAAQMKGDEAKVQETARAAGLKNAVDAARALGAVDNDTTLVLSAMQKFLGADCAREVLLSVAKRRVMERALVAPQGNWVFFYDQLNNLLGRAIQFWMPDRDALPEGERPRALYVLVEEPSAHDTVALDDFGRVAWSWRGLNDTWRHELEWLVEAVPRYAPIRGLRATLGSGIGAAAMTERRKPNGQWHRLVVARRKEFVARFGLTQVLDAPEDAFVISLDAPHVFRQALHNSVARTRQGVLRMQPARPSLTFLFATQYDGVGAARLNAWLGNTPASTAPRRPVTRFGVSGEAPGTYGELVYDEPPCMALTAQVGASADDVHSPEPVALGPLRRRRMHTPAAPRALQVSGPAANLQIDIELARLGWFYGGRSDPSVGQFMPGEAFAAFGSLPLLQLPDPEAELLLYFQFDAAQPLILAVHFRGRALTGQPWSTPERAVTLLDWGEIRTWIDAVVTLSDAGDLRIAAQKLNVVPLQIVARWRCNGLAVVPIHPQE